ncbi:phosphoserine phosphatase [Marmoricola sp. OAE513]|uniref:HAD family hydrolase n=1 Tax=Marmoricola sp. OAE513 TaxID=2817894 RepID=UPI001AEAEC2B
MKALHVLDLDGTLLHGTTANLEVARARGDLEVLLAMEAAFADGTMSTKEFSTELHRIWHDLTADEVAEIVAQSPWIDGIAEVCADIADRGEQSMLITMSPNFFAEAVLAHGVGTVHASHFPPLPFTEAFDPELTLVPEDKVRLVTAALDAAGLGTRSCVAYGDSLSDEPLFRVLENTVAVNPSPALAGIAAEVYRGRDLREAYALGRRLLADTGPA